MRSQPFVRLMLFVSVLSLIVTATWIGRYERLRGPVPFLPEAGAPPLELGGIADPPAQAGDGTGDPGAAAAGTTPTDAPVTAAPAPSADGVPTREDIQPWLQQIYDTRARALLAGVDQSILDPIYDTSVRTGTWALQHEQNRTRYMQQWQHKRGVQIVNFTTTPTITWFEPAAERVRLGVEESLELAYIYPNDPAGTVNRFGVGIRHWTELVLKDGAWVIRTDWYTDPLGDETLIPRPEPADGPADITGLAPLAEGPADGRDWDRDEPDAIYAAALASGWVYDREKAVAYADKYSGLAPGPNSSGKYNEKYRDYNGVGGDCTNYVSQVLGDPEAGNMPQDGTWFSRNGSGSLAWVQTRAFARWLQWSGRAQRIARGTYAQVALPTEEFPGSAVRQLELGDIIGYEEKGELQHFAIVTGFDSAGYPLINSHTADRYHVPFELGWDKSAVYWVFKVRDSL